MDTALDKATKEALLRDIIAEGSDAIMSFLNETMVWKDRVKKQAMIMMAQVTQCRCKKETVMTAPVTEQSPARYIY